MSKTKLEKKKKLFLKCYFLKNSFLLIVTFSDVFRAYNNVTLGWNGIESHITNTIYKNPKYCR